MCEAKPHPEEISAKDLQYNRPLKCASGFNHVVLLTQDNKLNRHVFSWGDCSGGKIGRMPSSRRRTQNALKIRALAAKNVTNVWACGNHSFYQFQTKVSAKRPARLGLCAWGLNNDGQLGLGHRREVVAPCEVPQFDEVKVLDVCGGEFHTLILTERQEVYSCGLNRDGQLGISSDLESSADFMPVILPEAVAHIASGGHFNYAVTVSGQVFSWGQGDNYVLGTGSERSESRPALVNPKLFNSEAVLCAVAGGQHGLFLTTDLQSQPSRPSKRSATDSRGSSAKRKKDL
jgi:regulator of chromosome condensation